MSCTHAMYEPGDRCSWCYTIVPKIATAERPAEPPQVASVGGEPLRQQQAPTRATTPTQGSAADPQHAEGDEAPIQPGRHLHNPASLSLDGPVGHDHGSVCGEATPALEGGGAGARSVTAPTLFDPPAARATDPITSHQAAASISEQRRRAVHAQVLIRLLTGPATDFDLARHTGLIPTSVGCRRKELCREGLVTALDRTGLSDTGSPATRWELTVKGRMAARIAADAA